MMASAIGTTDKAQKVQSIVEALTSDLENRTLSADKRASLLEQLKVYGREPRGCDVIFTKEAFSMLAEHGFVVNKDKPAAAREALRCIANAMLLVPNTRQIAVDVGIPEKAAVKLEGADIDDEFLFGRILLLVSHGTTLDLDKLMTDFKLEKSVQEALERHADAHTGKSPVRTQIEDMALVEILKLTFNLGYLSKRPEGVLESCVPDLLKLLLNRDLPPFPLQSPISLTINALLNVEFQNCKDVLLPADDRLLYIRRLVDILDKSIDPQHSETKDFDEHGIPLISLLRHILEADIPDVKGYLKQRLLPSERERNQPLGKGTTLAARLLQLSNSASTPNTRESIGYLLFELSNSKAEEFIFNVGYGYASGFLVSHNIPIPASSVEGTDPGTTGIPINPITGQTLESEPVLPDPFEDMSQEEKEREAERLFVLFERLKQTGIVDVENPVAQAVREGRFEELPDDEVD